MTDDRSPLISTGPVGSLPRRYPHHTLRRLCTVILGASLATLLAVFLLLLAFEDPAPAATDRLPGNATAHAAALRTYVRAIEASLPAPVSVSVSESAPVSVSLTTTRSEPGGDDVEALVASLARLSASVEALEAAAARLDTKAETLASQTRRGVPWWNPFVRRRLRRDIRAARVKYDDLERAFANPGGSSSKHVVSASGPGGGQTDGNPPPSPLRALFFSVFGSRLVRCVIRIATNSGYT